MKSIFQRSKYYSKTYADSSKIIEPLGYSFFNKNNKKPAHETKKRVGNLQIRYVNDKSNIKTISTRGTPYRDLIRYLKVTDAQRKTHYISSDNLNLIRNQINDGILGDLASKYLTQAEQEKIHLLEFVLILSTLQDQSLLAIKDYALLSYFVYFQGQSQSVSSFVKEFTEEEFLEYDVQMIECRKQQNKGQNQLKSVNYKNLQKVDELINKINALGEQKDQNYSGIHLFIGDQVQKQNNENILSEEEQNFGKLQYYIYLLTGILGEGQNAFIKIRGTYSHKTSEYLFLLKLVFNGKVTLHKSLLANPFSPQKYVICESYNKQNGKIIHQYLGSSYNLLTQYGDNKLLVISQMMFNQDFHINVKTFNDTCPIFKIFKEISKDFLKNENMELYPNREALKKKFEDLKALNRERFIDMIDKILPEEVKPQINPPEKEEVKNIQEAPPSISFDLFGTTQPKNITSAEKKPPKKDKNQDEVANYLKRVEQEKERKEKQKKEKQKKKKQNQEDHY